MKDFYTNGSKKLEQKIRVKGKEQLYDYYKSLGYNHKIASVLSLFSYGQYRLSYVSLDDMYAALCEGREDLTPEIREIRLREEAAARKREEERIAARKREQERIAAERKKEEKRIKAARERQIREALAALELVKSVTSASSPGPGGGETIEEETDIIALLQKLYEEGKFGDKILEFYYDDLAELGEAMFVEDISLPDCLPDSFTRPEPPERPRSRKERVSHTDRWRARAAAGRDVSGGLSESASAFYTGFSTDEYEKIEEKEARSTAAEPTSTFRMTANTASAGIILNQLRNGRRIDMSMVRIEEMLNYFRYESALPEREMFNISHEIMDCSDDVKYLYLNVQGREEIRDRQNIILLLDVSGSMRYNSELTQAIAATIISRLGSGDRLSLVTYSSHDSVELEAFEIKGESERVRALEKLLCIQIAGCTYGSKGIERAYRIGKEHYMEGGNNQVILITDGDLNFGITNKGGLKELIEEKKKDNLFLSVIGTGLYNFKDDKLEVLSKHGNGVYRVVNTLEDVRKSVFEEYSSLVNIIAKDVKAQVEFNPEVVESYRLLGFENRSLEREDFTDDKVISEPFGSGGYGVALYELKMKRGNEPVDSGLKYTRIITTGSKEPATVKIRYKEPLDEISHELEKVIETAEASFTDNLRLAFIVYVCAEKLRNSDKISEEETALAKKLFLELGDSIREKNKADMFWLTGLLLLE